MSEHPYQIKDFYLLIILIITVFASSQSHSYTWQFSQSCSFQGCANVRAESLLEYCEIYEKYEGDRIRTKYPTSPYYLSKVVYNYINLDGPGPVYASGWCEFNNNPANIKGAKLVGKQCPSGYTFDPEVLSCIKVDEKDCTAGNPITITHGKKREEIKDYELTFAGRKYEVRRYYENWISPVGQIFGNSSLLQQWAFSYTDKLTNSVINVTNGTDYYLARITTAEFGALYFYSEDGVIWGNRNNTQHKLLFSNTDGIVRWELQQSDGITKIFNDSGQLIEVMAPHLGYFVIGTRAIAGQSTLTYFMDIFHEGVLILSYKYINGNLVQILNSSEEVIIDYSYDSIGNLIIVQYENGSSTTYHYEDSNFPKALTGITDERGVRYATWAYDAQGRAISSEHAGGTDKTLLAFNADGSTTVTNPLGKQTTYHFDDIAGARRVTQVEGHATPSCEGANQNYTYTPEGWLASKSDWKGNITTYSYNTLGQEISRTEAFGTPQARTLTTEWHPDFYVKTRVVDGGKETLYTYDDNGRLLSTTTNPLPIQ